MIRNFLLAAILVLAAILRLWSLSAYPAGFTPDEASFGYDAYSLLATGKDQWGESFPLALRSFGDFKLPLYAYLSVPSVAIFGLSEFAVRLPNAIFGILAVLVTYLMVLELFKHESARKLARNFTKAVALLAALLLAVSPWHVSLSRGAFEANLTTLFIPLGVLAFYRGIQDRRWMAVSAFVFGLNLFSYHSARLVTPLIVLALILFKRKKVTPLCKGVTLAAIIFFLFFSFSVFQFFSGAGSRVSDVGIFNPTGGWGAVADRRYEAVLQDVPDFVARAFSNKATYVWNRFVGGYLSYLSPQFLFTQGAGEWTYGMIPGRGVLYLVELPFLLAALWYVARRKVDMPLKLLLLWILIAPIPAALAKGPGLAANRAAVMMPAIQVFSAFGALVLYEKFSKRWSKKALAGGFSIVLIFSLAFFLEDYIYHAPGGNAPAMSYGWRQAYTYINSIEGEYQTIVVSRALSEPHIFVAFYNKWDPRDYQVQAQDWLRYEKQGLPFVDQLGEYNLGKYVFRGIHYPVDKNLGDTLLVGLPRDFPEEVEALRVINYPGGEPAMLLVDPSGKVYAETR